MSAEDHPDIRSNANRGASSLQAWVRALERTAQIGRDPKATFPLLIDQLAERFTVAPALVSEIDSLNYHELAERVRRYARWAIHQGFAPGTTICLLLNNCADYLAIWLGLTRARLAVALLNTHLTGDSLAHSIRIAQPVAIIAGEAFTERVRAVREFIGPSVAYWTHRADDPDLPRIDHAISGLSGGPLDLTEFPPPTLTDRALYIYTSGTTGLPKAAVVTHLRLIRWAHWFSGMMDMRRCDRMYDCLPLYHSVGGVVATGATLTAGGTVILRERFSATRFWQDVKEQRCTVFQYIGELCRYLLANPPREGEATHELRLACGNGMQSTVWTSFQKRFRIPQVLEYYASTEGNVSLYNCEGRPGSVGRIPPFLSHRYPVVIVRSDPESGEPLRNEQDRCIPCAPNECGEVLGQIANGTEHASTQFEGYTDPESSRRKVLRDVFKTGDSWYRTGDLMRRDLQGFFYFVDRVGDTYRWHGENVSTTEVTAILTRCTGVTDVAVYGVQIPGTEGRAGMAALVVDSNFNVSLFQRESEQQLPSYARPLFLRIVRSLDRTATFKLQKNSLVAEGYDPTRITDVLFFRSSSGSYVSLTPTLFSNLRNGQERL